MVDVEFQLTAVQKCIFTGLMAIDEDLANIYKGAYYVLADSTNSDRFSQSAHSLREVTSLLSRVKNIPQTNIDEKEEEEKKEMMVVKLKKRFELEEGYTLPVVQPEIESILRQWNNVQGFLCSVAHHGRRIHRNLSETEYLKKVNELEDILEYFLRPSPLTLNELDKYIEMQKPTDLETNALLKLIAASPIYVEYFFTQLDTDNWLLILRDNGVFRTPQESITKDGGMLFPAWWPSVYFIKMAKTHQKVVMDIILEMDPTENIRVHSDLIEASLKMDSSEAIRIVPLVINWVKTKYPSIAIMKTRELCRKIVIEGDGVCAFILLQGLLSQGGCRQDPREGRRTINNHDLWEIEQVVDDLIPHFVKKYPLKTVTLLCATLDSCLMGNEQAEHDHEYSHIWRPAIEEHEQNLQRDDINGIIITAIRDCLTYIGKENPTILQQVITVLDGYSASIFRRLQIFTMKQYPDLLEERINSTVINVQLLESPENWHEIYHLLEERFPHLPPEVREMFYGIVQKGMDQKRVLEKCRRLYEGETIEGRVEELQARYRLRLLTPIKRYLSPEFKTTLIDLEEKLGPLEQPDFSNGYVKSEWGSEAAKRFIGLQDLSNTEIISLFKGKKNNNFLNNFGLEEAFESVVALNPERFLRMDIDFGGTPISFVVHTLEGLCKAQKSGINLNWPMVMASLDKLTSFSWDETHLGKEAFYSSNSVDFHSINVVDLFLSTNSNAELKGIVWHITKKLLDKYVLGPNKVQELVGGDDPLIRALNDLDGKSMGLLFDFIFWSSRVNGSKTNMDVNAEKVLEMILDKTIDDPSCVRTVIGMRIPFLYSQYPEWTMKNWEKILPDVTSHRKAWKLTWEGYILANKVYRDVYAVLRSNYIVAIRKIEGCSEEARAKLISHLVISYIHGLEDIDDSLLMVISSKSDSKVRGLILRDMGYVLSANLEKLSQEKCGEIANRCSSYWGWRLHEIKPPGDREKVALSEEFKEITGLFTSLPRNESDNLQMLQKTMELTGGVVHRPQQIIEKLIDYAGVNDFSIVAILYRILKADYPTWEREFCREGLFKLLSTLRTNADVELNEKIAIVADVVVHQGFFEFREFGTQ